MTLIHVTNDTADQNNHIYTELHRIGSHTLKVCVDFYPHSIEYSDAIISVLNDGRDWTELAEFSVDLWHEAAKSKTDPAERIADTYKTMIDFLLQVACEALGILPPSPAQVEPEEVKA